MKNEIVIQVPSGYQVICKREERDVFDAGALLRTKKRYMYTSAQRYGDKAVLQRHLIKCPFCGYEVPAYAHFLHPKVPDNRRIVPRGVVDAWSNPQHSFFEDDNASLVLNEVFIPESRYLCKKCGRESPHDRGSKEVRVVSERNKIIVSCKAQMKYVFDLLMKYSSQSSKLRFPLIECVEFNLGNGHVSLAVRNDDGSAVLIRDITYAKHLWKNAETYDAIKDNFLVRRALKRCFTKIYGGMLPFSPSELSPESFIAMTQFVGYPRAFYDTIPYELSSENIERSFVAISRRMHSTHYLDRLYASTALPRMKSIRKLFFSEPGFFFYIHEAEILWSVFADPNHYRNLLAMPRIYELLSNLRQYPGVYLFLQDYKAIKGAGHLLASLTSKFDATLEYAVNYCSMSTIARKRDQKAWNKKNVSARRRITHSIPMQMGCHGIKDSCVDGYTFSWLRTKYEYSQAGSALRNCLAAWSVDNNPVVVVKKGEIFKAAIEIKDGCVVQARAIHNAPIEHDEKLNKAIEKWKLINQLKPIRFIVGDDEDDEDGLWF